jgi:hypothetical protein
MLDEQKLFRVVKFNVGKNGSKTPGIGETYFYRPGQERDMAKILKQSAFRQKSRQLAMQGCNEVSLEKKSSAPLYC